MKRLFPFLVLLCYVGFGTLMVGCASKHKRTSKSTKTATMRSYKVHGKRYYPTYVEIGDSQRGISSWYGPHFNGKKTSNGERYNMHASTAAHKTWPMGTMVKVVNLQNKKSTIVRINDRGPFVKGRIIDCSYRAGKALGLDKMGVAKVSIKVVGLNGKTSFSSKSKNPSRHSHITSTTKGVSRFGIQVSSFKNYKGAQSDKERYAKRYPYHSPVIKRLRVGSQTLYKVCLMGFSSRKKAEEFKAKYHLRGAFIVHG